MNRAPLVADSREILRTHARSFSLAARFLPADRRDDAAVLYAFCRHVDDVADEATDPLIAGEDLYDLRLEVLGARERRPVVAETVRILEAGGFGIEPALHLIDGAQSDLDRVRMGSDEELIRYCYRVAGTVGLMMCAALGVVDPQAHAFAIDLGIGMQLTNISRDVAEDARMGRVYVPVDRLARVGVGPEALLNGSADRVAVGSVVLDLLDLADRYYESAEHGMRFIPWRSRLAIMVASRVYRGIGTVLRRRGGDVFAGRAYTTPLHKTWLVVVAVASFLGGSASDVRHDGQLHRAIRGFQGAA